MEGQPEIYLYISAHFDALNFRGININMLYTDVALLEVCKFYCVVLIFMLLENEH
jgi:hypothetical protein